MRHMHGNELRDITTLTQSMNVTCMHGQFDIFPRFILLGPYIKNNFFLLINLADQEIFIIFF